MLIIFLIIDFRGNVIIAVLTSTIRGQTSFKKLRNGNFLKILIDQFSRLPDLKIAHKKRSASPTHNEAWKSYVVISFTASRVSSAHPRRTRWRNRNDITETTTEDIIIIYKACTIFSCAR